MAIRDDFDAAGVDGGAYEGDRGEAATIRAAQADTNPAPQPEPEPNEGEAPATLTVAIEDGNIARLPAGTDISNPRVDGTDLEFVQPDGTVVLIPNGAVQGLTLFIGDIEIPAESVAALFESSGIQTALGPEGGDPGPAQDGHGNYEMTGPQSVGQGLQWGGLLGNSTSGSNTTFTSSDLNDNLPPSFPSDRIELVRVSDEGLSEGNPDDLGSDDSTDAATATGNLGIVDFEDHPLEFALGTPVALFNGVAGAFTSGGVPIVWTGIGTEEIVGSANGIEIIRIAITEGRQADGVGNYAVTLSGPVDHLNDGRPGTEDDMQLEITITASDSLGASSSATLVLGIEDDSPEIVAPAPSGNLLVNGDFLAPGDFPDAHPWGDNGHGGIDTDGISGWVGGQIERVGDNYLGMTTSNGNPMIDMAASPGNIEITQTVSGLGDGELYTIRFEAGAPEPASAVLEVVWNGVVVGTIFPTGDMTEYSLAVTAQSGDNMLAFRETGDADGDPLPSGGTDGHHGTYLANVTLTAGGQALVDEDGRPDGLDGGDGDAVGDAVSATGSLNIAWGADRGDTVDGKDGQDGAITGSDDNTDLTGRAVYFSSNVVTWVGHSEPLTSRGDVVTFTLDDSGTRLIGEAGGRTVIEVTLSDDGDGSYTFVLSDVLDHPENGTEDDIELQFDFTARDFDGDPISGSFSVTVDDDTPAVTGELSAADVDEDDLDNAEALNGFGIFDIIEGSTGTSPDSNSTDDGDYGTGPLGFILKELLGGTTYDNGSLADTVDFGADGPGQFFHNGNEDALRSLSSHGETVDYTSIAVSLNGFSGSLVLGYVSNIEDEHVDGVLALLESAINGEVDFADLEADAKSLFEEIADQLGSEVPEFRLVFGLGTLGDGSYQFRLFDQLDHAEGTTEDEAFTIDFSALFGARDGDGDALTLPEGTFTVTVADDAPALAPRGSEERTVDEDDIATWWSRGTHPDDGAGDGSFTGSPWGNFGGPARIVGDLAPLVRPGADEPLAFRFVGEGEARATLEALHLTSAGHELSYDIRGNTLTGFLNRPGVGEHFNPFLGDTPVFTLTLQSDGNYLFRLFDQLDHDAPGAGDAFGLRGSDADGLVFGEIIEAFDADGDSVRLNNSFRIAIHDDRPEIATDSDNLVFNGSFEDGHGPGNGGWDAFTDIRGWTSGNGVPFEVQVGNPGGGLDAHEGDTKLELDSHGNPSNSVVEQTIAGTVDGQVYQLSFWYAPRPNDGDPDSSSLEVRWNGSKVLAIDSTGHAEGWTQYTLTVVGTGGPDVLGFAATGQENTRGAYLDGVQLHAVNTIAIDEDGLKAGIGDTAAGDDSVADEFPRFGFDGNEATATGSLGIRWGADAADAGFDGFDFEPESPAAGSYQTRQQDDPGGAANRSVVFTDAEVQIAGVDALKSRGEEVSFALVDGGTRLVGTAGSRTVLDVRLTDELQGGYRVALLDTLDHAPGADENNVGLTFGFTATDSDGDTITGSFAVTIDDDSPVVDDSTGGEVEEGTGPQVVTTTLNVDWGADGEAGRTLEFADGAVTATGPNDSTLAALTSYGRTVTTALVGDVLTGYVGTDNPPEEKDVVFRVELDAATGEQTFTLLQPLDHPAPVGGEHFIDLSFDYTATDNDGDGTGGSFTVRVDAAGAIGSIDYSALDTGVVVNLGDTGFTVPFLWQEIAGNTATDLDKVSIPGLDVGGGNVVGIDSVDGIVDAYGSSDSDILVGSDEDNVLKGNGGHDAILGRAGNDTIRGGTGIDLLLGGRGDDDIKGNGGLDVIFGGAGNDTIDGGSVADLIGGGRGDDTIDGNGGADLIRGGGGDDIISGGRGGDDIEGGAGHDSISGNGGVDHIHGDDGDDIISGGAGADEIFGGGGADEISGGSGGDLIFGDGGDDTIKGNGGRDHMHGGAGDDTISGGAGADEIYGGDGRDELGGGSGEDLLRGNSGNDTIRGGAGDDDLYGNTGSDKLHGGGGDDYLSGGTGSDELHGGAGHDVLRGNAASDMMFGGGGGDRLIGNSGNEDLHGGAGDDDLEGGSDTDTAHYVASLSSTHFSYDTGTDAWVVTTPGGEGKDTLTGVEIVESGGGRFLLVGGGSEYATIQAAVDAAQPGDTIVIAPGIYQEQVQIEGPGKDGISLVAANGPGTVVIEPPATLVQTADSPTSGKDTFSIISVEGADGVHIEDITVDGQQRGGEVSSGATLVGITYFESDGGIIDGVTITGIREDDASFGAQRGVGIYVVNPDVTPAARTPADAELGGLNSIEIRNSTIADFQKGAVVVANADVNIHDNTITGIGPTDWTAQNGIQVTGSTGSISGNIVTAIGYTGSSWASSLILGYYNNGLLIDGNTLTGTGSTHLIMGVALVDSTGAVVTNNVISNLGWPIAVQDYPGGAAMLPGDGTVFTGNSFASVGYEYLYFEPDAATLAPFHVTGTAGTDIIYGAAGEDVLEGEGGNDVLDGRGGDDILRGGDGDDDMSGGDGNDRLGGKDGDDFLHGDVGDDMLWGDGGNDRLIGDGGDDMLSGQAGNDRLRGGKGDDQLSGGSGDDTFLYAVGDGTDTVDGGSEGATGDLLDITNTGGATTFTIDGSGGDPIEIGIDNAAGSDSITATDIEDIDIHLGAGGDQVDIVAPLVGTSLSTSTITVEGGAGNDTVDADAIDAGHPVTVDFTGGAGDDHFVSGAGDDLFTGGDGTDTAVYSGSWTDYTITYVPETGKLTVADNNGDAGGNDGSDTLEGVETLKFDGGLTTLGPVRVFDTGNVLVGSYDAIQEAIDANSTLDGYTVRVGEGTFDPFTVDKDITVIGSGPGTVIKGGLRDGNPEIESAYDGSVFDWVANAHGVGPTSDVGVTIAASGASIQGFRIVDANTGVLLRGSTELTNIDIANVDISGFVQGIKKYAEQEIDGLTITGGSLSDGYEGIVLQKNTAAGHNATDVTVNGTSFADLVSKGIYAETLQGTTVFANLDMTDVGAFGRGDSFGNAGEWGSGIDVNLKFGAYTGSITIEDFDFTNVGTSVGNGTDSHFGGSAIAIKGRDDGGTYGADPAIVGNLDVEIRDGRIDGTSTGIRVGEPGKDDSAGNVTGPAVTVSNVEITGNVDNEHHAQFDNVSQSTLTVNAPAADGVADTVTFADTPTSSGAIVYNGNDDAETVTTAGGDDSFDGAGGDDTMDGGGGSDTALYDAALTAGDFDPTGGGWTVATGGSEGTDQLTDIEIVRGQDPDGAGAATGRFLLVGNGGFSTIQDAVDAAQPGDTVLVAPGAWGGATIDKPLSIVGFGHGDDPVTDTIVENGGFIVDLDTDAVDGTVSLQHLAIAGPPGAGVKAQDGEILGTLELDTVRIANSEGSGLIVSGRKPSGAYEQAGVQHVRILDSSFVDNAQSTGNSANIMLFEFDGDATIANVVASNSVSGGSSAAYGIQIAGFDGPHYDQLSPDGGSSLGSYDVLTPMGTVVIDGLEVSGQVRKVGLYIQGYTDTTGLVITNSEVDVVSGWGKPVIIDPMADQSPDGTANDAANGGSFFDEMAANGSYDLGGLTVVQKPGHINELDGTTKADTITGTNANDQITGFEGDDTLDGGVGDDTLRYGTGHGADTIMGGTGDDLVQVGGNGGANRFAIENLDDDLASLELTVDGETSTVAGVEDIAIVGGGGADTLTVAGDLGGTGLSQSTIHFDGGYGDDTIDLSGRDSAHRVVVDGGQGNDTAVLGFASTDSYSFDDIHDADGTVLGVRVTHEVGGEQVMDEFLGVERFVFSDGVVQVFGGTVHEAGELAGIIEAEPTGDLAPAAALATEITDALDTLEDAPDGLTDVLATITGAMGGDTAKAIAVIWDHLDDSYIDDGPNWVNESMVRLGVAYADGLKHGEMPLHDVTAKFTADGDDAGSQPDRMQSLHENLLGNLNSSPFERRFGGEPVHDELAALITGVDPELPARPINHGYESDPEADTTNAQKWDINHGLLSSSISGQLAGPGGATGWTVTGTVDGSALDLYGEMTVDVSGQWTFRLNDSSTATQALTHGEVVEQAFTFVAGGKSAEVTVTISGANDAPVVNNAPEMKVINHAFVDEDGFGNHNDDDDRSGENAPPFGWEETIWNSWVRFDYGSTAEAAGATFELLDDPDLDAQLVTLNGDPITFELTADGELVGKAGGDPIITIIPTTTDGSGSPVVDHGYQVTLHQPVQHDPDNAENYKTVEVPFRVTDGNGDQADDTFNLNVYDDIPITTTGETVTYEAALAYAGFGSDGDGIVTTDFDGAHDEGQSVALQSDGKIVVAGSSHNGTNVDFALARYNADGTLDTSFGPNGDGKIRMPVGPASDEGYSVAIQPDGKIVVAGYAYLESGIDPSADFAVVRYNADGTLDTSFGSGDGIVTTPVGSSLDVIRSIMLQPDGKILVAGSAHDGSSYDFGLVRYNENGSLDTSFGDGGKVTTHVGSSNNEGNSAALQPDGKILVVGYSEIDPGHGVASDLVITLARYTADGALDISFDGDGIVTTPVSFHDIGYSITVQPDGKILVAGDSEASGDDDFTLIRYNPNGSLDDSFGGDGIVVTAVTWVTDKGQSVALQPDGKILVAGYAHNGASTGHDFAILRYNSDGTLDSGFGGGDGIVTTPITDTHDYGHDLVVQPDGKIVVVGHSGGLDGDFALVRYNSDGTLDMDVSGSQAVDLAALVDFGADGAAAGGGFSLSSDFRGLSDQNLTSDGESLAYSVEGNVLTAYKTDTDGDPVFTFTLASDGTGTFELLAPIGTPGPGTFDIDLSSTVIATDGDGDEILLDGTSFTFAIADNLYGGSGMDTLNGGAGNDVLTGGAGDDVLIGGAGDDVLSGGAGDDVLIGGFGGDTLTGGDGADTFVIDNLDVADLITDYEDADKVDLSVLLDDLYGDGIATTKDVNVEQSGSDVVVRVDTDTSVDTTTWQDVAVLDGYGAGGIIIDITTGEIFST